MSVPTDKLTKPFWGVYNVGRDIWAEGSQRGGEGVKTLAVYYTEDGAQTRAESMNRQLAGSWKPELLKVVRA